MSVEKDRKALQELAKVLIGPQMAPLDEISTQVARDPDPHELTPEEPAWTHEITEEELVGMEHDTEEHTGGSSSYYRVYIQIPQEEGYDAYWAECVDVIEALGLTYSEANAFKAIWRRGAERTFGKSKKGNNSLYDAEKVQFFGTRMVAQEAVLDRAEDG